MRQPCHPILCWPRIPVTRAPALERTHSTPRPLPLCVTHPHPRHGHDQGRRTRAGRRQRAGPTRCARTCICVPSCPTTHGSQRLLHVRQLTHVAAAPPAASPPCPPTLLLAKPGPRGGAAAGLQAGPPSEPESAPY